MTKRSDLDKRVMIGRNLCKAREMAKMTQSTVMQIVFDEPRQKNRICEIETGKSLPDAELLHVLCKLYGVSSDWILGFTIEPELDETAARAGMLYNGLSETLGTMLQSLTTQLSLVGVRHIQSMPKPSMLALLDAAKKYIKNTQVNHESENYIAFLELMSCVREAEKNLAIQHRNLEMSLDDIANRDEDERYTQILHDIVSSNISRYPLTALSKAAPSDSVQHDLF